MNSKVKSCKDCKKTVSKRAKVCPHCGAPVDSGAEDIVVKIISYCIVWGLLAWGVYALFVTEEGVQKKETAIKSKVPIAAKVERTPKLASVPKKELEMGKEELKRLIDKEAPPLKRQEAPEFFKAWGEEAVNQANVLVREAFLLTRKKHPKGKANMCGVDVTTRPPYMGLFCWVREGKTSKRVEYVLSKKKGKMTLAAVADHCIYKKNKFVAFLKAKRAVKEQLNDPYSAVFSERYWVELVLPCNFIVHGELRAKNAYGAFVASRFTATIDLSRGVNDWVSKGVSFD